MLRCGSNWEFRESLRGRGLVVLSGGALPRSSKSSPDRKEGERERRSLRVTARSASLACTASNSSRSTIAGCSPLCLSDIDAVLEDIGERPDREMARTDADAIWTDARLWFDAAPIEILDEKPDRTNVEIARKMVLTCSAS